MLNLPPTVKPGQPVRASHHNLIIKSLEQLGTIHGKTRPFQRSRAIPDTSHPFKITLGEDSNGAKIVRVAAGYWIGDGVTAYGWTGDTELPGINTEMPPNMQDTFRVSAYEHKFSKSETRKIWFCVSPSAKVGRVYGTWESESIDPTNPSETEMFMVNRMHVSYVPGDNFVSEILKTRPYCVLLGYVDFKTGEIVQLVRDNINYAPKPGVATPLVFHPVQNAENTFECLGGLLRVLPNTVKGGKRAVGHLYDLEGGGSLSGNFDATGCVPMSETLQAYTTAIPPWRFKIDKLIEAESENGGAPVNGWLVFLRVRMAYKNCYPMDTECVVPVPVIEWDYAPIPNGGAKVGSPWEFTNTEVQGFSSTELEGAHRTFTHVKNGERMPIPNTFIGTWTSSIYDWSFDYTFAVNTEAFESIIPIGIFHCPFVPASNWSSSSFRTQERIVYCPLKTGIIDWTPPAEFDFKKTNFLWND